MNMMSRHISKQQHRVANDSRGVVVQTNIEMWLDIMFMDGVPELISVAGPVDEVAGHVGTVDSVLDHIHQ